MGKLEKDQQSTIAAHPGKSSSLQNAVQDKYNFNALKTEYPSRYDPIVGNMNHQEEMMQMEAMGLSTNFQQQGPDYPYHRDFFCNTCHVQNDHSTSYGSSFEWRTTFEDTIEQRIVRKRKSKNGWTIQLHQIRGSRKKT